MIELRSILDNDLYKFSMGNVISRLFPRLNVRYEFINRGKHKFPHGFASRIISNFVSFQNLRLSSAEKNFLRSKCPYLDPVYLDFLEGYKLNPFEDLKINQDGDDLKITIEGPWYRTIYWEVPLMALISEEYYNATLSTPVNLTVEPCREKARQIKQMGITVSDFGTRRRFSLDNHKLVLNQMKDALVGTSNAYLAMIYNMKPIGTQAHEWIQAHAAIYGFQMANHMAMENWISVFRGDLGIALSDTYTTEVFLRSFDKKLARLFDGVRQDSGDPIEQAKKIIAHYKSIGIDPTTKTLVFSDSLNLDKVRKIHEFCNGKIRDVYGIGTNLTNDVGVEPLNIVIKLSAVELDGRWVNTVKLSDTSGKHTGDPRTIQLCKEILGIST